MNRSQLVEVGRAGREEESWLKDRVQWKREIVPTPPGNLSAAGEERGGGEEWREKRKED